MIEKLKNIKKDKFLLRYTIFNLMIFWGLLAEFLFWEYGIMKIIRYLVLVEALFVIAWKDKKEKIILNKDLAILLGVRCLLFVFEWLLYPNYGLGIVFSSLLGFLIGAAVFGICYIVSRGGLGAGDVKLMAVLGFYLGGSMLISTMVLAVFCSALYSIVNLIRKKTSLKAEIPFAPFVMMGTVLAMALGA